MSDIEPLTSNRPIPVRIAEQVLARIRTGEFPVGAKLPPELELARLFGVSRPSVREALGALQFVGYLDSVRGSGNTVISTSPSSDFSGAVPTDVTGRDLLDLFEARMRIEPHVAAAAATDPHEEKLDEAQSLIEGMRLAVDEPTLHADTDLRIHRAFVHVCQNPFLRMPALRLLDVTASAALRATRESAWESEDLPSLWVSQHHQVLDAIRARDAVAAAAATWEHVASSAANALHVLGPDPRLVEPARRLRALLEDGPGAGSGSAPRGRGGRTGAVALVRSDT